MAIANGYAALEDVKADLRLQTTNDDERIERCIEAASRQIDNATHRSWVAATGLRIFGSDGYVVWVNDASAVTAVTESDDMLTWSTVASTVYYTNPQPPIRNLTRPDRYWLRFVRLDATWGSGTVPPEVHTACRIQAVRLFKRPDTPEGVLAGDFGAARLARIDPDVLALIRPYVRTGMA